jgi:hypothetical protein
MGTLPASQARLASTLPMRNRDINEALQRPLRQPLRFGIAYTFDGLVKA